MRHKAYYYSILYNNQIKARALIGQSAVGKIARLLNYYIKAIDHIKFLWFIS